MCVIAAESGVAAGVRRIEAVTGFDSLAMFQRDRAVLAGIGTALNARPSEVAARIEALQDDTKRLAHELQQARMQVALGGASTGQSDGATEVSGVKVIAREVSGLDKDGLRALVDQQRSIIGSGVVILACPTDGKVTIVVGVTGDLTKRVPAGQVVKQLAPIVGGGGGGRPDFAEAGGKDASRVGELLAEAPRLIERMLSV
jgi:alanyl-tRNA synthetase